MEPKGSSVGQYGPVNGRYTERNKFSPRPHKTLKFLPIHKSHPLGFPTNCLHAFLIIPMQATCSAHLFLCDLFTLITFREERKLWSFSLCFLESAFTSFLRCVHITRARAGARQACARRETRRAFTCACKSSSTLVQLLARLRRVRIRIFTRSVHRL
jgi:hypothetical protein